MDNLITRRFSVSVEFPITALSEYIHTPHPELPGMCYESYVVTTTVIDVPALEHYLMALEAEWEATYDDESFKLALSLALGKVREKLGLPHAAVWGHVTGKHKPVVKVTNLRPFFGGDDLNVHCRVYAGNVEFKLTCPLSHVIEKVKALYEASDLPKVEEFEEAFLDFLSRTPATLDVETSEIIMALGIHNVHVTVKPFD